MPTSTLELAMMMMTTKLKINHINNKEEQQHTLVVQNVPIVRVFGSTPAGQKTCLHIHNLFPYFFVEYSDQLSLQLEQVNTYIRKLVASINQAMGQSFSSHQHIFNARMVKGKPFYGYYPQDKMFIKLILYNPDSMNKVAGLLRNGSIMGRKFEVYEAHIPFMLQVFLDHNLAGMSFINFDNILFRKPLPSCKRLWGGNQQDLSQDTSFDNSRIERRRWFSEFCRSDDPAFKHLWSPIQSRKTTCELEVDGDIFRTTNINYNNKSPTRTTEIEEKLVHSLRLIWDDELDRRREHGMTTQFTQAQSQTRKPFPLGYFAKPLAFKKIDEIIAQEDIIVRKRIQEREQQRRQQQKQQHDDDVDDDVNNQQKTIIDSQPMYDIDLAQPSGSQTLFAIPPSNSPGLSLQSDPSISFCSPSTTIKNTNKPATTSVTNNVQSQHDEFDHHQDPVVEPDTLAMPPPPFPPSPSPPLSPPPPLNNQVVEDSDIKDKGHENNDDDDDDDEEQGEAQSQQEIKDILAASQLYNKMFSQAYASWSDEEGEELISPPPLDEANNKYLSLKRKTPPTNDVVMANNQDVQRQRLDPRAEEEEEYDTDIPQYDGGRDDYIREKKRRPSSHVHNNINNNNNNNTGLIQLPIPTPLVTKSTTKFNHRFDNNRLIAVPSDQGPEEDPIMSSQKPSTTSTTTTTTTTSTPKSKTKSKTSKHHHSSSSSSSHGAHSNRVHKQQPTSLRFGSANPTTSTTSTTSTPSTNGSGRKHRHIDIEYNNNNYNVDNSPTRARTSTTTTSLKSCMKKTTTGRHDAKRVRFDIPSEEFVSETQYPAQVTTTTVFEPTPMPSLSDSMMVISSSATLFVPETPPSEESPTKTSLLRQDIVPSSTSPCAPSQQTDVFIDPSANVVAQQQFQPNVQALAQPAQAQPLVRVESPTISPEPMATPPTQPSPVTALTMPFTMWSPVKDSGGAIFSPSSTPLTLPITSPKFEQLKVPVGESPTKDNLPPVIDVMPPPPPQPNTPPPPQLPVGNTIHKKGKSPTPPSPYKDALTPPRQHTPPPPLFAPPSPPPPLYEPIKLRTKTVVSKPDAAVHLPIHSPPPSPPSPPSLPPPPHISHTLPDEKMQEQDQEEEDMMMDSPISIIDVAENDEDDEGMMSLSLHHQSPTPPVSPPPQSKGSKSDSGMDFSFGSMQPTTVDNTRGQKPVSPQPPAAIKTIYNKSPSPSIALFTDGGGGGYTRETCDGVVTLSHRPPSNVDLLKELTMTNKPINIYKDAFYSNETDMVKKRLGDVPPFKSNIKQIKGISYWRSLEGARQPRVPEAKVYTLSIPPPSPASLLQAFKNRDTTTANSYHLHPPQPQPKADHNLVVDNFDGKRGAPKNVDYSQVSQGTPTFSYIAKLRPDNQDSVQSLQSNMNQFLTILSVEIHVNTRDTLNPNPELDGIESVFYCCRDEGQIEAQGENYKDLCGVIMVGDRSEQATANHLGFDCQVTYCADEHELLKTFCQLVRSFDVDIFVGFEIQLLSLGYMIERARAIGVSLCDEVSRVISPVQAQFNMKSDNYFSRELDRFGYDHSSGISIIGRIVINTWRLLRHEITLDNYTFANLSFHCLKRRVPEFSYETLTSWYQSGQRWRTLSYYIDRTKGNLDLIYSFDIIGRTSELARVYGIDFFSILSRGSQFRVESMLLRLTKPENYILYSPSREQTTNQPMPECIPLVMDPISKLFNSPIVVLDFQSLYPSIMIAYNYCYSTCLGKVMPVDPVTNDKRMGSGKINIKPGLLKLLHDNIQAAPNEVMYTNQQTRRGLFPKLLSEVLETRIMVKKAMKKHRGNKKIYNMLDARQLALKMMANVSYGYTAATFSGRMSCIELGDSIVQTARETLEGAIKIVEQSKEWRAKVVYGDTDSLFVLLPGVSREEAFVIGQRIADKVTSMNPRPVRLMFEKVYHPTLLVNKKRYVGYKYENASQQEPIFDAKGIETVRRDQCKLVSKIMERTIRILFEKKDLSLVKSYMMKQWQKIFQDRVSLRDFVFAKAVKLGNYSTNGTLPAAAQLAMRIMEKDPRGEPRYGERVRYVVVYGTPQSRLCDLVISPSEFIANKHLRINIIYYITKQIIPAMDRILKLVGVNIHQWYSSFPKQYAATPNQRINLFFSNNHHMIQQHQQQQLQQHDQQQQYTIDQFYHSINCFVCGDGVPVNNNNNDEWMYVEESVRLPLCQSCYEDPQASHFILVNRLNSIEQQKNKLQEICHTCIGHQTYTTDIECQSLDCEAFYERVKLLALYNNINKWHQSVANS
ncbi:hypothetical protein SAMD00019534_058120 [Acytostelium subglobosum LB1]|uniref:hypothetical protein n=1 Tax=Acytostelium subglobosum LB1 TaxID=1410327 RepID=UPI000644CFF5|nr:hypothetical protein SAMD00019534_058120 [Acytostelium subglobosum LB1]GAM22637.1 hypothetical protein SAMD00019534_058120 [Acytostelium subglobosum LB1]|eukprot:XP_012754757.1 hypothetical protein SAMD00019534_058120 [Acytostelium subglobosum LB1]